MMLTESLSFTDKALTTIALAIVVASLGVIMWGIGYALWSMLDWIAERTDKWRMK